MTLAQVRRIALSFPETTEQPHHHMTSFRVGGKIFATAPPQGTHLHVFVDDPHRDVAVRARPAACETLLWGGKAAGVRVTLKAATVALVRDLLESAWQRKAPKRLQA